MMMMTIKIKQKLSKKLKIIKHHAKNELISTQKKSSSACGIPHQLEKIFFQKSFLMSYLEFSWGHFFHFQLLFWHLHGWITHHFFEKLTKMIKGPPKRTLWSPGQAPGVNGSIKWFLDGKNDYVGEKYYYHT